MVGIKSLITTSSQKKKFNQFNEKVNFIRSKFSFLKNSNINEELDEEIVLALKNNDVTRGKITSYDVYTPNINKSGGAWEVRVNTNPNYSTKEYLALPSSGEYEKKRENIIVYSISDKELELSKEYKDFINKTPAKK